MAHSQQILNATRKASREIKVRSDLFRAEMVLNKVLGLLKGKR